MVKVALTVSILIGVVGAQGQRWEPSTTLNCVPVQGRGSLYLQLLCGVTREQVSEFKLHMMGSGKALGAVLMKGSEHHWLCDDVRKTCRLIIHTVRQAKSP